MCFWIEHLELFVLALSDQQLLTGLLLLICAYGKYWDFSVQCGGNNMWNAIDVGCFSCLTHAATLLTLRSYFRRHRILAAVRVVFMYIIYILLLVAIVHILKPNHKENGRPKLSSPLTKFWHATSYIELVGIFWVYLITYLPIFLSKEAMRVRICLAMNANELPSALAEWEPYQRQMDKWFDQYTRITWFNPYKVIRSHLTKSAVVFSRRFEKAGPWARILFWTFSEILFPFWSTPVLLLILWLYGLGFMGLRIAQNNVTTNWSFGQWLPIFVVLLPFHTFIGSIAGEFLLTFCWYCWTNNRSRETTNYTRGNPLGIYALPSNTACTVRI
jgi:hypothetical protein